MSSEGRGLHRLVYGVLPWISTTDAVVVHAGIAEKWARAASSHTLAEFRQGVYGETWDEYIEANFYPDEPVPSPDDPFDFAEWLAENTGPNPEHEAWAYLHERVDELVAEGSELAATIGSGGGSPGGNINAVSGSLEAIAYLASRIDFERDGYFLERDDELVQAAYPRRIFL